MYEGGGHREIYYNYQQNLKLASRIQTKNNRTHFTVAQKVSSNHVGLASLPGSCRGGETLLLDLQEPENEGSRFDQLTVPQSGLST